MRIFIDKELLVNSSDRAKVEKDLNDWTEKHGDRVIYAYEWDDVIHYDDWVKFLSERVHSEETMNLITKPVVQLQQEMRESVLTYCLNLKEQLPLVIENLFGTEPERESDHLADLFEGISYLISSASLLSIDVDLGERHQATLDLSHAFSEKDYVEIADLLKYEWLPWIEQYEKTLQSLHVGM